MMGTLAFCGFTLLGLGSTSLRLSLNVDTSWEYDDVRFSFAGRKPHVVSIDYILGAVWVASTSLLCFSFQQQLVYCDAHVQLDDFKKKYTFIYPLGQLPTLSPWSL
jgi:hypothetical protein